MGSVPYFTTAPMYPFSSISSTGSYAFACTTAMTVPLSASLIAGTPPPASRNARSRSFELLNVLSTVLAALLMLPLVIIVTSPRALVGGVDGRTSTSTTPSNNFILGLRIATLVFSIPSVVVSIISLPLYGSVHRFIRTDLALSIIITAIFALSLVPSTVSGILDDAMMILTVFGTFLLPGMFSAPHLVIEDQPVIVIVFSIDTHHYSLLPSPSLHRRAPRAIVCSEYSTFLQF